MTYLKVEEPLGGRAIVNLIGCEPNEKVEAFVSVKEFDDNHYIVMATQKGIVKKTVLSAWKTQKRWNLCYRN